MAIVHNLGFPRIGAKRELKFGLESYWKGESSKSELESLGEELRQRHWQQQSQLDWVPVGDFSLYDQVLDMSFILGNLPSRVSALNCDELDRYFCNARGRSVTGPDQFSIQAGEMTKWFDTNYHYIVPEFTEDTSFDLNPERLLRQIAEAQNQGLSAKPVLIGPVTYLWLGKSKDDSNRLSLLEQLLPVYKQLLQTLAQQGIQWVQIDEPILSTELAPEWQQALVQAYQTLSQVEPKLLLTNYFGPLKDNLSLVCQLPVAGFHIDAISAQQEAVQLAENLNDEQILSLGIIDGRNIWRTDLNTAIERLTPIHKQLKQRLWLAPTCSLLHVPVDITPEQNINSEVKPWLAFANQKLEELTVLTAALNEGCDAVAEELAENQRVINARKGSALVNNTEVKQKAQSISSELGQRNRPFAERTALQSEKLKLPKFPTTTIGSFPQTAEIRKKRRELKQGNIELHEYRQFMQQEIKHCIEVQHRLGLDVLVHGEPERNDMVEYFGEQLSGYTFSQFGWVQSYGSRCVKPPILFGDISRPNAMTVEWATYAQSLTNKPVKGMLTGPVTILNWSFVRDDQPLSETCNQLALAIREEVLDLERAGIDIIQIDEAALREGLPLRQSEWSNYLGWAIEAFRICANGVDDQTQIHTHMCYSDFNDIIESIADMDADVITIETSRSEMRLLDAFDDFSYPNQIGPGVYDIHSPNLPEVTAMTSLMDQAAKRIPAERLWVNPDCGLKTRSWDEVIPALENMVETAKQLRQSLA